jgi:hypothetical protein
MLDMQSRLEQGQQVKDDQVGRLVRQTRSRTKATACTQSCTISTHEHEQGIRQQQHQQQ